MLISGGPRKGFSALLRQQIDRVAKSVVGLEKPLGEAIEQGEKGKQIVDAVAAFFGGGFFGVAAQGFGRQFGPAAAQSV